MNITHVGKIGRLPRMIRDQLGRRIEDGEPGKDVVKWLNGLPVVQEVLQEYFEGRPITEQNLSEWKQAGHREWLRAEEDRLSAERLADHALGLGEDVMELGENFARLMAVEMSRLATELVDKETDPEKRWARLCEAHRELSVLRRDNFRSIRAGIKREKWEIEMDRLSKGAVDDEESEARARLTAMFHSLLQRKELVKLFGGKKSGEKLADWLFQIQHGPLNANGVPMEMEGLEKTDENNQGNKG